MADDRNSIQHGMLVRQWKWPLRVVFWWVMIGACVWVYAIAAHWYWARHAIPEAPAAHGRAVVESEWVALAQLQPQVFEPLEVAKKIAGTLQEGVLDACVGAARALMNWPTQFRAKQATASGGTAAQGQFDAGAEFVADQLAAGGEALNMLATGTQIFATRTALYVAALPLVGLLVAVALVDGLVARAKRKARAGRESASLYHRAKLGLSFVAIVGYIACVGAPSIAHPARLLVPLAALIAIAVRIQASYYKKYL